jgi:hypothetical protein
MQAACESGASGFAGGLERFEPLKAVGGVSPVLNADLRGQKPTLAEQIGVCQRFYQRFSAFQNTEPSNSLSPTAEPGVYQCNYVSDKAAASCRIPNYLQFSFGWCDSRCG